MTLHELVKQISEILTPENDAFYKYVLYTSDDNFGFLRTRYCWWPDRPVRDRGIGDGYEVVMVTSRRRIKASELLDESETKVKLQLHYEFKNATVEDASWDAGLGYCFVYLFDLANKTYTVTQI